MSDTPFKDHFSARASDYALFRPAYPLDLANYLASLPTRTELAWDSGCGSGQFSNQLARHFDRVEATDASIEQLAGAERVSGITYRQARAEASGLPADCVDLAVSAQAAHWYDLDAYYREVRRVARDGAVIALIAYGRSTLDADIAEIFDDFYDHVTGPYWPPERKIVEAGYCTLAFPFEEITSPDFVMQADWSLTQLLGYVDTWSAMRGLEKAQGRGPYEQFASEIAQAWGDPGRIRRVTWPLALRAGRI